MSFAFTHPALAPFDIHNQQLAANVHPTDWLNPQPKNCYDLVVIGAGTAGLVTAAGAAGLGAKVALIERELMGGDCLNVGCVPSKALIRAAKACAQAHSASEFGVSIGASWAADFSVAMERLRRLRAGISHHDSAARFKSLGVDVFIGEGRFKDKTSIEVDGKQLHFSHAVIATGARAADLPIPGLREAGYLTNENVFSLTTLPKSLAVIGAGPIGCELAQAFARFGSKVIMLEQGKRFLPREDRDAADIVKESLRTDGVEFNTDATIQSVRTIGNQKQIKLETSTGPQTLSVDHILIGVGRAPNVGGLNMEAAGVTYDTRSGVNVDDHLRTSNRRIFAAGDICFPYKFTHAADAMARIVIQNALFFGRKKASALLIPWCTYTEPEVAHVGLYASEAQAKGLSFETIKIDMADIDRAILDSDTQGFVKIHYEKKTGKILGATLVAAHAGDIISEVTVAMAAGMSLGKLAAVIHPYPTQAEVIKRAADAFNRTRLTPRVKSFLGILIRLSR